MKKMTLEFQLGFHIGNYIVCKYLPTLNIDLLQTRNVINVTDEEYKKYKQLDDRWFNKSFNKELDSTEEWNELLKFRHEMEKKYIPEILECYVDYFMVDNVNEFKKGILDSLWNSDLSHYCDSINDIIIDEIDKEFEDMYIRRKISLRRAINE
jgi:hypothetical protein